MYSHAIDKLNSMQSAVNKPNRDQWLILQEVAIYLDQLSQNVSVPP
jgi:hypothetical protein